MAYEEDVSRHGQFVKTWLRYLKYKVQAEPHVRFVIFERAVNQLVGNIFSLFFKIEAHDRIDRFSRALTSSGTCI